MSVWLLGNRLVAPRWIASSLAVGLLSLPAACSAADAVGPAGTTGGSDAHPPVAAALRDQPLPPEQALKTLQLPPGFRVQLAAAEPQVIDPVSAAFDHLGRLWVVEMRDYPTGPADGGPPQGQIALLQDRDGDGFYEQRTTFADGLVFPTGLLPYRQGVVVTLAGEVCYLADTDGDGVSDQRETWFTGFSEDNEQLRANHPYWTLENQIHVASGLRGGQIRSAQPRWSDSEQPLSIAARDFRFSPFGGSWHSTAGNSQFGFYQDDWGRNYVCSNRNPCQILLGEVNQVAGNPLLPLNQWRVDVMPAAENSQVFPLVQAWTTSNLHAGQFTAACGNFRYQSDWLSEWLDGDFFACEPTGSLVQRYQLVQNDVVPQAQRDRPGVEFLASTDEWFRPVDLLDGPDGALYVIDMHRAVIEHPDWMPVELRSRQDMRWGDQAGRIYRIVPDSATGKASESPRAAFDFENSSPRQWADALASPNRWARTTAARLLAQQLDDWANAGTATDSAAATDSLIERLREITRAGGLQNAGQLTADELAQGQARAAAAALWLLQSSGHLTADDVRAAARFPDPRVRQQAVRLAAQRLLPAATDADWAAVGDGLAALAVDPDPIVRYQWLLEVAPQADGRFLDSLVQAAQVISASQSDRLWPSRALSLVDQSQAAPLIQRLLQDQAADHRPLLMPLARRLGWQGDAATLDVLIDDAQQDRRLFDQFAAGAATRGTPWDTIAGSLPPPSGQRLNDLLDADRQRVQDDASPLDQRVAALKRVGLDRSPQTLVLCRDLLQRDGGPLFIESLALIRHWPDEPVAQSLVQRLVQLPPQASQAAVTALVNQAAWTEPLVDALEAQSVPWGMIDPATLGRLERHSNPQIARRVAAMRAGSNNEDRQQLIQRYQAVLHQAADLAAGKQHFVRHCAGCHRVDEQGVAVGPDISDLRTQTPEQILLSILDPSAAIDANYYRYAVLTADGQLIEGLLVDSNQQSVTLALQDGINRTIAQDEVEQLRATGVSMMPDGFETQLDPDAMRDLVAYLKSWRLLSTPIPLGN